MYSLKELLFVGACGVATTALVWSFWTADVAQLKLSHKNALAAQQRSLEEACEKDKAITKEVSDELQTKLDDAAAQLARAKRVQQNRCVPISAHPAQQRDGSTQDGELYHAHGGVTSDALLDFAYDAEVVGRQLDACQSFIGKVWGR